MTNIISKNYDDEFFKSFKITEVTSWTVNGDIYPFLTGFDIIWPSDNKTINDERYFITNDNQLRDILCMKFEHDLGMKFDEDYIFESLTVNPARSFIVISGHLDNEIDMKIKIKTDEHYTMFKMHYG